MTTGNCHSRFAALARLVTPALASCAIAACVGHSPTHPAAGRGVEETPSAREYAGTAKDEAEVKRDLAKNKRDTLSVSEAGYYLDVLQARLVQVLGADVRLSRTPDRIGIDLAHRVPFESSGPRLSEVSCRLLQPLASAFAEYRKTVVAVKVGVDGTGKEAERLAERRAHAVAKCLESFGVASRRMVVVASRSTESVPAADAAEADLELDVELILRDAANNR